MKVLMATMQLGIGGAETHIVELSKALFAMGVDVMVASNGGEYVSELEEAGIKHFKVGLNRKDPISLIRAYKELKRIITQNNIDVVHAHARIPGFLCGILKRRLNLRFVTTAHWVFSTKFPFNLLTNWGERSLAVSDDIRNYLVENYGSRHENIRVTINGVDTKKFSDDIDFSDIADEFGFGENKERIVYVSRMDTDRSLAAHKLIEVTPYIRSKIHNLEVVIVGGGNDFENIKNEAEAINKELGERVIIVTGGRTDINKFVASAKVFVGVSRAALEAMAAKKPAVIAGNEGYIGIFDEGKLSLAIDTNFCCRGCEEVSAKSLSEDLISILGEENRERQKTLGEYSFETVKKYYSIETMANDAMMMYASIVMGIPVNEVKPWDIEDIEKYLVSGNGKRNIDAVISGYYGFNNSGDDSILESIISGLKKKCPRISITVLSKNPKETRRIYKVNSVGRFDFLRLWGLFKRTKLLISGGGSLIQDVTSSKSLYYYLSVIRLAKMRGAKVMLYANGIGPVIREKNLKHIKRTLRLVDVISLREESSLLEAERIMGEECESARLSVTSDPVFSLDIEDGDIDDVLNRAGILKDEKYFVISVREWKTLDKAFEEKVASFGDEIYRMYKIKPMVVPMQGLFDRKISESIAEKFSVPFGESFDGYSPKLMMRVIEGAEFVLGMRLHTLLYAVKMGVPCIALDYDPKVEAAMKSLGFGYFEKVEDVNVPKLLEFSKEIIENKEKIGGEIEKKSKEFKDLANKDIEDAINLMK